LIDLSLTFTAIAVAHLDVIQALPNEAVTKNEHSRVGIPTLLTLLLKHIPRENNPYTSLSKKIPTIKPVFILK
jgi:hypothetical protein